MISLNYGLNGIPLVMLNHLRLDGLLKLCVHECLAIIVLSINTISFKQNLPNLS